MYHVVDFAGLYPVWLIIKFSMLPTGALKDDRMTSSTKCVTALLSKMLYLDEMAMIAPLMITNNNKDSYIFNKAYLPSNFTKLSKSNI